MAHRGGSVGSNEKKLKLAGMNQDWREKSNDGVVVREESTGLTQPCPGHDSSPAAASCPRRGRGTPAAWRASGERLKEGYQPPPLVGGGGSRDSYQTLTVSTNFSPPPGFARIRTEPRKKIRPTPPAEGALQPHAFSLAWAGVSQTANRPRGHLTRSQDGPNSRVADFSVKKGQIASSRPRGGFQGKSGELAGANGSKRQRHGREVKSLGIFENNS